MEYFNNRLRELREKKGLKLELMAKLMQMSKSYLSQLELNTRRISMKDYCQALDILGYELTIRKKGDVENVMDITKIDKVLIEGEQYEIKDRIPTFEKLASRIDCYNNLEDKLYYPKNDGLLEFLYDSQSCLPSYGSLKYEQVYLCYRCYEVLKNNNSKSYMLISLDPEDWENHWSNDVIRICKDSKKGGYLLEQIDMNGNIIYIDTYYSEDEVIIACINLKRECSKNIDNEEMKNIKVEEIDLLDKTNFKFDSKLLDMCLTYNKDIDEVKYIDTDILKGCMQLECLIEKFNIVEYLYGDYQCSYEYKQMQREIELIKKDNITDIKYSMRGNSNYGEIEVVLKTGTLLNIVCSKDINNNIFYDLNYIELTKCYKYLGRLNSPKDVFKIILSSILDKKDIDSISLEEILNQERYFYCDPNYERFVAELIDEKKVYTPITTSSIEYIDKVNYLINEFNIHSNGKLNFLEFEYDSGEYRSNEYYIVAKDENNNTYKFNITWELEVYMKIEQADGKYYNLGLQEGVEDALSKIK